MAPPQFDWKLPSGYGEFLRGKAIQAQLDGKTARLVAALSPAGIARRTEPVDLHFSLRRTLKRGLPGSAVLRLVPEGALAARVLFSGNAFLGNFRIPPHHFGIQWTVQGAVEGSATLRGMGTVAAATRWARSWVTEFPVEDASAQEALLESWRAWFNLLDPRQASRIGDGQVHRLTWAGELKSVLEVNWSLLQGWAVPLEPGFLKMTAGASVEAGASLDFRVTRGGRFQLQLSRRRDKTVLSLRQVSEREVAGEAAARIGAGTTVRLTRLSSGRPRLDRYLTEPLARPLLAEANRRLSRAVVRRLQASLSVELSRHRGHTRFGRIEWTVHRPESLRRAHRALVNGRFPEAETGARLSGILERVRERRLEVRLNVLDWLVLSRSRSRRRVERSSLTADGHLLIERAVSMDRLRATRRSRQAASVLLRSLGPGEAQELRWSLSREGRFDLRRLRNWVRLGLHAGILESAAIPARREFPLQLRFLLVAEFSGEGLERVRGASSAEWWKALVRVLEIQAPERYGRPGFWRDWVDFPVVREVIDREPVQSWRAGRYPISGRTTAERRRVVAEYRRARRFLQLVEGWKEGDQERLLSLLSSGLDAPAFLFFCRICPVGLRRGAGLLEGDREAAWGDDTLLL